MDKTKAHQGQTHEVQKPSLRKFWRNLGISALVIISILFLAALLMPTLDGPNRRRRANEAVAVGNLRRIIALQNDYPASHPSQGFACRLPLLKPTVPTRDDYDQDAFLLSEHHVGYRIAIKGCEGDPGGVVTHYQTTAVPLEPGKSGVLAFCADQTGMIRYDFGGSAETCLTAGRALN
jgi:hypothetical protein